MAKLCLDTDRAVMVCSFYLLAVNECVSNVFSSLFFLIDFKN